VRFWLLSSTGVSGMAVYESKPAQLILNRISQETGSDLKKIN
jgi:hypothetical protein